MGTQKERKTRSAALSKLQLVHSEKHILYNPVETQGRQVAKYIMKDGYSTILEKHFRDGLIHERDRMGITQEQMAEILSISNYGYSKLERGKCCCGGVSLSLFLTDCCEDREKFIEDLKAEYDKLREGEYAKL